jgi:protein tyrosine/serine phosphatase
MWSNKRFKRTVIIAAVIFIPVGAYLGVMSALDRAPFLNFAVVDEGKLMRSAQPLPGDLEWIIEKHGLGTVISLRGRGESETRVWARDHGVKMIMIQMYADDPPTDKQQELFFEIMRGDTVRLDRYSNIILQTINVDKGKLEAGFPKPVLIHCIGGADRTGVMTALYRMEFQGWDLEEAKREMMMHRHIPPAHPKLFEFLEEWQGGKEDLNSKAASGQ